MNARVRDSNGGYEDRIGDPSLAASIGSVNLNKLEPAFQFAGLSKAEQRRRIKENALKTQAQEKTASFNHFYTLMNYANFRWQKMTRARKSDGQLKMKLESADIVVIDQRTEKNSEKTLISEEEFKRLRELYWALTELVTYKNCQATWPRGGHPINPNTIAKVDGKDFNASHIGVINYEGCEISLVASMGVNPKKKEAVSFFKWVQQETQNTKDGTPGRQVVLVNLTEQHENLSYMPEDTQDSVRLGGSAKSYSCFSRDDFNEPYSLNRLFIKNGKGINLTPVEKDSDSNSRFWKMQIQNEQGVVLSEKTIISVSSETEDHYPIKNLINRAKKFKDLITKDKPTKDQPKKDQSTEDQLIKRKTLVVNCKAGMGRTSQPIILMMIAAELEQGTDKTVEELLIDNVWKFCAARRFFAVNEAGFINLYCCTRELLKEIQANRDQASQPSSTSDPSQRSAVSATNIEEIQEVANDPSSDNSSETLQPQDFQKKKNLREQEQELLNVGSSFSVKALEVYLNNVLGIQQEGDVQSIAQKEIEEHTTSISAEKELPDSFEEVNQLKPHKKEKLLTKLTKLLNGDKNKKKQINSQTPSVMDQAGSTATVSPTNNLNVSTTLSAALIEPRSLNAEEAQKNQPSNSSGRKRTANLIARFNHGSSHPAPPSNWRV